jgi:hypothetical protein
VLNKVYNLDRTCVSIIRLFQDEDKSDICHFVFNFKESHAQISLMLAFYSHHHEKKCRSHGYVETDYRAYIIDDFKDRFLMKIVLHENYIRSILPQELSFFIILFTASQLRFVIHLPGFHKKSFSIHVLMVMVNIILVFQ